MAPEANAVYGYEAARVALEAIRKAEKKDRAVITETCLAHKEYKGVAGAFRFDANGDTTLKQLTIMRVEDGDFKFVKVLTGE